MQSVAIGDVAIPRSGGSSWKAASYKIRDFGSCVFEPGITELAADLTRRVLVVIVAQTVTGGPDFCDGPIVAHAYRLTP